MQLFARFLHLRRLPKLLISEDRKLKGRESKMKKLTNLFVTSLFSVVMFMAIINSSETVLNKDHTLGYSSICPVPAPPLPSMVNNTTK